MNLPDLQLIKQINHLTKSNKSFAIYRLPWSDTPILVMQESYNTETVLSLNDLNGKKGFVISPFCITEEHPVIIIRPDIIATGWDEIERCINIFSNESTEYISTEIDTISSEEEQKINYFSAFDRFIAPLKNNEFKKLVLSRKAGYKLNDNFSPTEAFITACNSYPRMMISLIHCPLCGTWIGSTPEIILSGNGHEWRTVSLAGTMQMNGSSIPEKWTDKNKEEQAIVSSYIKDILRNICKEVRVNGPYAVQAGPLAHLKTDFNFYINDTSGLGNILESLYPTPAICGLPKHSAYKFILENEGYDRGYYSGIIGWLNPEGDTNLYVNLRCVNILEHCAVYYAGGGLLPASDAISEWEETRHKMNTMRRCLTKDL